MRAPRSIKPGVWLVESAQDATERARLHAELDPEGMAWLVIPIPHRVSRNAWVVGRADLLAELITQRGSQAGRTVGELGSPASPGRWSE